MGVDFDSEVMDAIRYMDNFVASQGYRVESPNHASKSLTYDGFVKASDDIIGPLSEVVNTLYGD
jgi:hypothetical protein